MKTWCRRVRYWRNFCPFGIAAMILNGRDLSTCLGRKGDAVQTSKRLPVQIIELIIQRQEKRWFFMTLSITFQKIIKSGRFCLKDISWTGVVWRLSKGPFPQSEANPTWRWHFLWCKCHWAAEREKKSEDWVPWVLSWVGLDQLRLSNLSGVLLTIYQNHE